MAVRSDRKWGRSAGSSKAFNDAVSAKQAIRLLEDHFTSGVTKPAFVVVATDYVTAPDVQGAVAAFVERVEAG